MFQTGQLTGAFPRCSVVQRALLRVARRRNAHALQEVSKPSNYGVSTETHDTAPPQPALVDFLFWIAPTYRSLAMI